MIKYIIAFAFIVGAHLSFAGPIRVQIPPVTLSKSEFDESPQKNEAVYRFTFFNMNDKIEKRVIQYSIDGYEYKKNLIDNAYLEIETRPGKHIFQFFYNKKYLEVFTDSLAIKPRFRDHYSVRLRTSMNEVKTLKPVIYLYPESEIDIEVKLDIKDGQNPFLYPAYNDGWKCKASPDGTLQIGKSTYNYLFWEAEQPSQLTVENNHSGFLVHGDQTISFLEDKLTQAGLSSKEQADFITFWGPILSQNDVNFVRFEFNDACNKFAELNISPKPDNIYRIYILSTPVSADYEVTEQQIIPMNREGFTVVEWGGQDISTASRQDIQTLKHATR